MMAGIAKKVTVDLTSNKLFIDGTEFPWFITTDGVDVLNVGSKEELAVVRLAIIAETVEIIPKEIG